MGISRFTHLPVFSVLLAPVKSIAALLMPHQSAGAIAVGKLHEENRFLSSVANTTPLNAQQSCRSAMASTMTNDSSRFLPGAKHSGQALSRHRSTGLKVMREFEPATGRSPSGRIVISGHISDVCAELERMTQREG
jgi:hypothetical protein